MLSQRGREYIDKPYELTMYEDHDFDQEAREVEQYEKEITSAKSYDEDLYDVLRALRKKVAKQKGLPPFAIFQDPSIEEMATTYPTTKEELLQINGVGMGKANKFGKPFLDAINEYVEENDISTAADVVVKTAVNKSKIKIFIIQQIDRRVDIEEIADSKNLSMEELIEEIEHICYSGTKLNLDYYINQILDDGKQDEIYDYFMTAKNDNMAEAVAYFDEDYTEEELRLMRVKFLSEVAN